MNKLVVFDLFAGAGGFGLGFKQAGTDVVLSIEMDKWASDTLRYNHPDMIVIQDDIRNYTQLENILSIYSQKPDIIIGGPPCQGFSISGPSKKDPKDPRNSLFINFAHWVKLLMPHVFVMENVRGLTSRFNANGQRVVDIIQQTFIDIGYSVNVWLLNASEYGVPQSRERIFIVGTRDKILSPPPPSHIIESGKKQLSLMGFQLEDRISVWDAISDLPVLEAGQGEEIAPYINSPLTEYQKRLRGNSQELYNHVAMKHTKRMVERFKNIQWGESVSSVTKEHAPRQRGNNLLVSEKVYDQNNRRLFPDKPSHTITASFYANFIHPYQQRNLTAREGARLQSFPDNYRFWGKPTVVSQKLLQRENRTDEAFLCQYNQIGNAVPPLLAESIARHIMKEYFNC